MHLPNIWGQGALFAFSGLDGECRVHNCLNGALLGDLLGIRIHAKELFDLYISLDGIKDIEYEVVASDVIRARLKDAQGLQSDLIFTFLDQKTIVGLCGQGRAQLRSLRALSEVRSEHGSMYTSGASAYHFWRSDREGQTVFSFSSNGFAPVSSEQVTALAQKRIAYLEGFEALCPRDEALRLTFLKTLSIMKSQVYTADGQFNQRWTTPNRLPHRWLWLWDSVFHSIGNVILDETLPKDTLLSVLDVQKPDGFVPHLARPNFTSDITQPPLLAWGALKIYEKTKDIDFLAQVLPKLKMYLEWDIANRMSPETGLFRWHVNTDSAVCRADESGMDNSPRFDGVSVMECIDFSCFMLSEAQAMEKICAALGLEDEKKWASYAETLKKAINDYLWDEHDGCYYDRVSESGCFHKVRSIAGFLPLFAGACSERTAKILSDKLKNPATFDTPMPLPSIARDDESFSLDMWRGAVWINCNYLISLGLRRYGFNEQADDIIVRTVKSIARFYMTDGVIYEMYDPDGLVPPRCIHRKGRPIEPYDPRVRYQAIRDYGWSGSLFAAMIAENSHLFR